MSDEDDHKDDVDEGAPSTPSHPSIFEDTVFPDGSIKRIEYTRFLTYDRATCTPGPNMNVIIGANGAGKSTIICGICLAVGGSPKILGRSERFGDYVKHGSKDGSVEVVIADSHVHGGEVSFKAVLKLPNSCVYYVNGRKQSQAQIRSLIKDYNIQIDNPCTFLAQDKVKSFSMQNPQDLLLNTEKAGHTELFDRHQSIIVKKKEEGSLEQKLGAIDSKLEAMRNEMTILEPKVENFKRKQKMQSRIRILEKKKTILEFDEAASKYENSNETVRSLQKSLRKFEKQHETFHKELQKEHDQQRILQNDTAKVRQQIHDQKKTIMDCNKPHGYQEAMDEANGKMESVRNDAATWNAKLAGLRRELAMAERGMATAEGHMDGYKEAEKENQEKVSAFTKKIEEYYREIEQLEKKRDALERERADCYDVHRRNDLLRSVRMRGLYGAEEAYKYYWTHKNEFQHPVYVPLIDMVVRGNQMTLRQLAHCMATRDYNTFIFGSKKDELTLTKLYPNINTTTIPERMLNESINDLKVTMDNDLKQFGFKSTLLEVISGPDSIRLFCAKIGMGTVLIGDSNVDRNYVEIAHKLKHTSFNIYLTESGRVSSSTSRYSGEVLVNYSKFRQDNASIMIQELLRGYENDQVEKMEKIKKMLEDIHHQVTDKQIKQRDAAEERIRLRGKWKEWSDRKMELKRAADQVASRKAVLQDHERFNKPDLERAEAAFKIHQQKQLKIALRNATKLVVATEALEKLEIQRFIGRNLEGKMDLKVHRLEDSVREKIEHIRMCKDDIETQRGAIVDEERAFRLAKQNLKQICGFPTTDQHKLNNDHIVIFDAMNKAFAEEKVPEDKDDVLREMADEEARLNLATSGDGTADDSRRFTQLTVEREKLTDERKKAKGAREDYDKELETMVDEWLNPLAELVEKISENFTRFFKHMGCTGEVRLESPENKLDVNKYGIEILVRFRDTEKLRKLDHQTQSGGERSVSTMLYLLSLQELCPVPFRCVDEINQGMDPTNERKVFELMVDTLNADGNLSKTQYFLLTPKLLRGLKYGEKVAVQIVHNSANIPDDCQTWDHGTFLKMMPVS